MLDDFQVVRFFEHFGEQLFDGIEVPLDRVKAGIPEAVRSIVTFAQIESLPPDQAERLIAPAEAAALARNTLFYLAEDETLAALIEKSLDSHRDDEMVADVILAVGFVASMILIAATTEVEGTILGVKFKKSEASPTLVKAIVEPFAKVLSGSPKPKAKQRVVSEHATQRRRPNMRAQTGC
ncbi:MAG TPA: hypothetical protein VLK82_10250 [Candidatus Tectomicrobia bacterium]|nr:hypothetical protein [Candidatus Tectomicrobia bacterium]